MAVVYHNPIIPVAVVPVDMTRLGLSSKNSPAPITNSAEVSEASRTVRLPAPAA